MNIMKINMLSLNEKMAKEKTANSAVSVPNMAATQSGMNALTFLGLKNLMEDPQLAQETGVMKDGAGKDESAKSYVAPFSSNIAFQGVAATKAAKTLAATAILASAAALTSCEKNYYDMPPAETKTEITITVTNEQTTALLNSMVTLLAQMLEQQKISQAEFQAYMQQVIAWQGQTSNDLNAIKTLLSSMAAKIIDIDNGVQENNAYQQIIISMLETQGYSHSEAIAILKEAIQWAKDHGGDILSALQQIMEKLDLVNQNLENILNVVIDARDKAAEDRAALLEVALQIREQNNASLYQQQIMINQNNALIMQNNIIIQNQKLIVKKIEESTAKTNATIKEVAAAIGMKLDDLATIIVKTGKSLEDVMKMSKEEILAVLKANNEELQNVNNNLQNLDSDAVKAAEQILAILNQISAQLSELSKQFADAVKMFRSKLDNLTFIAGGIYNNGVANNMMLAQLNQQVFDLRKDVKSIKITAMQIRDNLKNGVSVDTKQLEEMFKILNMHQQASAAEIIARLDAFIAGQEKLEAAINKLGDENNSKLDYIASLIQNKTNDNAGLIEAINNLAKSNEENITAAVEALAAKLDALIAKVDAALAKMDNLAKLVKQYGDQILAKFGVAEDILAAIKANGAKIDITNMNLAELKAEVEKIKPELLKLQTSANTANTYLDILTKRALEIKEQIANLEAIAGKGLTKEELEELWKKHDADNYNKYTAFLNSLHAEDIGKANEIIALMKEGNLTNKNIYELLLDFANKTNLTAEQLRDLLKAVYEYLPELKCNCNCQGDCDNNGNHEGIIGDLLD